jgi:hypothetical protein
MFWPSSWRVWWPNSLLRKGQRLAHEEGVEVRSWKQFLSGRHWFYSSVSFLTGSYRQRFYFVLCVQMDILSCFFLEICNAYIAKFIDHFHQNFRLHLYTPLGHIELHAFSRKVCAVYMYYWKSCIKMQIVTTTSETTTWASVLICKKSIFPVGVSVHILYPVFAVCWLKTSIRCITKFVSNFRMKCIRIEISCCMTNYLARKKNCRRFLNIILHAIHWGEW